MSAEQAPPVAETEEVIASPVTKADVMAADEAASQRVISAELGEMMEMESMCPKCRENGTTRLMITKIPHFREVIVSSFECANEECGERNNEIQFGGTYGEMHTVYELHVDGAKDLNRQVVKSDSATITIPQLQLEIPPNSQKGTLNTVEGVLSVVVDGLQQDQPVRKVMHPEVYEQIEQFCAKLEAYKNGTTPFDLIIEDPAGNSYVEAYFDHYHPTIDPKLKKIMRPRTDIERQMLGLALEYNQNVRSEAQQRAVDDGHLEDEVMELQQACPACTHDGVLRAHKCDIPYFQETLIMCFKCDDCGYKTTEVKNGGAISPKGRRITLTVLKEDDMKRDILKSDSAQIIIPEIELELSPGTLGGFFTTVEGLLNQVYDAIKKIRQTDFDSGDSRLYDPRRMAEQTGGMKSFLDRLAQLRDGNVYPFTIILDDPLACIYVQNPKAHLPPPENEDPQIVSEEYERTEEQNEEFGIAALLANEAAYNAKLAAEKEQENQQKQQ